MVGGGTERQNRGRAGEDEDEEKPRGEINPVKVVLMFLSILIADVHVCVYTA